MSKYPMDSGQPVWQVPISDRDTPQKPEESETSGAGTVQADYVLNTNTKKFHLPSCSSADDIKESNRQEYNGSREDLIAQGYDPCKRCNP